MVVLRRTIGDVLRDQRRRQGRTLREVSSTARVSLGYLSEVERGQKEASSELLASICSALELPLSHVLHEVTQRVAVEEGGREPYTAEGVVPVPAEPAAAAEPVVVLPQDVPGGAAGTGDATGELTGDLVERLGAAVPDVLPEALVAGLRHPVQPADLPGDLLDALVDLLPECAPGELERALEGRRRRRRLVPVA